MSTIKVDTLNTRTGSGNITISRPTILTAGDIIRADIAADAIDGTKIADDAINSEHYADASIDNAHLADDAVGVAELSATGTASSSTFLRGDNSWAAAGGGENNHTSFARGFSGSGQNQSISTNTMTVLEFSAETFDADGDFNTTTDRYIAPANGYYLIIGAAIYSGLSNGIVNALAITINNAIKSSAVNSMATSSFNSVHVTDVYYMTTGQYVQLKTYHENSNTKGIDADGWGGFGPYGSGTYLSVARVG